ncbi:Barwin-like endoglucanase [Cynara cardunculus var. scolymus]|uniref:Barwin-like endoglucanase n=1 Tax=Cynara cardunculus var. scolymus TaxID=59895 RepID=A0A124SFQ9_CYNCS|nr:Barwin-like endoglucanase [Cynara cardunculus var. scolymus]
MGFFYFCFSLFLSISISISISSINACDRCVHQSRVSFFPKAFSLSSGACGYGSLATALYGDHLAAAVPKIYKSGSGCGDCFQVRCKDSSLCTENGTRVIVTDLAQSNQTDFVLSHRAFIGMAKKGMRPYLLKLAVVDDGSSNWSPMNRIYGAVWDTNRYLAGALQLRLLVISGYDGKWIWANTVLPADWEIKGVYNSPIQIDDIAQEGCSQCDQQIWN